MHVTQDERSHLQDSDPKSREAALPLPRGRQRNPETHRRVLASTLELIKTVGYSRLTIEAVARNAGVGRPTIYRWWGSKAELAHEAVFEGVPAVPEADTGNLSSDLREHVAYLVDILSRPEVVAYFRGVVAEPELDQRLGQLAGVRTSLARQRYAEVFKRATRRGEITEKIDADVSFFALYGGIQTWLLFGPKVSRKRLAQRFLELIEDVVDAHRA